MTRFDENYRFARICHPLQVPILKACEPPKHHTTSPTSPRRAKHSVLRSVPASSSLEPARSSFARQLAEVDSLRFITALALVAGAVLLVLDRILNFRTTPSEARPSPPERLLASHHVRTSLS